MDKVIKFFVGLDVHKGSISIAMCEPGREAARYAGTIRHDVPTLLKVLRKYGEAAQVSVVYEAGPTGYGLYRELTGHGYPCQVIAPSLTPHRGGDRIKNDRRDCLRLAELSRAGELTAIWIPDAAHEALRNLWRAPRRRGEHATQGPSTTEGIPAAPRTRLSGQDGLEPHAPALDRRSAVRTKRRSTGVCRISACRRRYPGSRGAAQWCTGAERTA